MPRTPEKPPQVAQVLHTDDARFRLAMASAGTGVAIVSLDGQWLEVNPALCRMLGHAADALVGQPAAGFIHPDDLGVTPPLVESLLAGGQQSGEVEKRYLAADGRSIGVRESVALMRDGAGAPTCFIVQLQPVTAQDDDVRALREINASLEQRVHACTEALDVATRRLETFAYGVSHDLRAPLRAIDGFAKNLERNAGPSLDAADLDGLQRIRAASQRMGSLIDSLIELARVGRAELRPERVDVSLLAEWAAMELQEGQPQRSARVTVQPGLDVVGDERMLKALLTQLLRNAWQFSAQGSQVEVDVEGVRSPDSLQLEVRDRGIGFDMSYAGKLFEPFQRLHGREEGAGHGIGLSIAQQVAARHGGRIWAEATPGHGATFHVKLHDLSAPERTA